MGVDDGDLLLIVIIDVEMMMENFPSSFPAFFFSERAPGVIWFGSVYLVTTAGFVPDQLMRDKQQI